MSNPSKPVLKFKVKAKVRVAVMIHFPVVKYYAIPQKTAIAGYQNMMSAEKEKKFSPKKQMGSLTICKQWKIIFIPAKSKGNQNGKNEEQQKFFQKLQIISEQVTVSEVYEDFQQSLQNVTAHVNLKRIQACVFHEDIKDANTRVVQVNSKVHYELEEM